MFLPRSLWSDRFVGCEGFGQTDWARQFKDFRSAGVHSSKLVFDSVLPSLFPPPMYSPHKLLGFDPLSTQKYRSFHPHQRTRSGIILWCGAVRHGALRIGSTYDWMSECLCICFKLRGSLMLAMILVMIWGVRWKGDLDTDGYEEEGSTVLLQKAKHGEGIFWLSYKTHRCCLVRRDLF